MKPLPTLLRALPLAVLAGLFASLAAAPVFTQQPPATVIVTSGQPATFAAQATGVGTIRWQWRRMGSPLAGQTGASLTLPTAKMAEVGYYDVVVTDNNGSTTSRPSRLLVTPIGGYPTSVRLDTTFNPIFETDGASINCIAAAPDGSIYVAGNFTRIAGQPRSGLARFTASLDLSPDFAPPFAANIARMVVQPDRKLLLRASVRLTDGRNQGPILRLNADGSLDESFVPAEFQLSSGYLGFSPIALQPDGKILVAGSFDSVGALPRSTIARLNADGSVDPTFNASLGSGPSVSSIVVSGGKIVLYGSFRTALGSYQQLIRLNGDGTVDPSFTQSPLAQYFSAPLVTDVSGRVYAGAAFEAGKYPRLATLVRLLEDGSIDPSYACALDAIPIPSCAAAMPDGGIAVGWFSGPTNFFGALTSDGSLKFSPQQFPLTSADRVSAVAVSGTNQLFFGGYTSTVGLPFSGGVARYTETGTRDATAPTGLRSGGYPEKIFAAPGGKWLVAGGFTYANNVRRSGLARLNADGTTDTAFDAAGLGFSLQELVVQGDGAILAVGDGQPVARRLLANGQPDPSFDFKATKGFSGSTLQGNMRVLPDGRLVASGWISSYNGEYLNTGLLVLLPDGQRDPSFSLSFRPTSNPFNDLLADPNGGFVVSGSISDNTYLSRSLVWLNARGELLFPQGSDQGPNSVNAIANDASGRLLVGGSFQSIGGVSRIGFARLNDNGSVATTGSTPIPISLPFSGAGITAQNDNKVLLEASYRPSADGPIYGPLLRLNADDSLDTTFRVADLQGSLLLRSAMRFTDEGRLLVCGRIGVRNGVAFNGLVLLKPETMPPAPTIVRQPASLTLPAGATAVFKVEASGEVYAYRWYKDSYAIPGASGAKYVLPNLVAGTQTVLSVEVTGPGGSVLSNSANLVVTDGTISFASWIAASDTPANQRGALDAPAGDGVANLIKYALGVPPMSNAGTHLPGAMLREAAGQPSSIALVFAKNRLATGIRYALEISTDLVLWNEVATTTESLGLNPDGAEMVRMFETSPTTSPRRFFRLKVVATDP